MNAKILLIAFSAAAFTSCSTAYKSGQTPDDVYYSPVKVMEEKKDDEKKREETRPQENTADYNRMRMTYRDRRWRELDNDYDYSYSYNNSPYRYCTCNCSNYGYFYNPYYYSKPLYTPRVIPSAPINSTPRTVNLNTYKNYATATHTDPKTGVTTSQTTTRQYNNSNGGSKVGNILREVFTPSSNNSNSTNNNSRTYTPSTNNSSSSGSSNSGSSGGSSSGGSVSRPGRG